MAIPLALDIGWFFTPDRLYYWTDDTGQHWLIVEWGGDGQLHHEQLKHLTGVYTVQTGMRVGLGPDGRRMLIVLMTAPPEPLPPTGSQAD